MAVPGYSESMAVVRLLRSLSPAEESPPADPGDAALVRAAREGSRVAQEALFRRHLRRVTALSRRTLCASEGEVDDLVQDCFLQAFTRLDSLREDSAFGAWLSAIVVRTASKRLRRKRLLERLGLRQAEPVDLERIIRHDAPPELRMELAALFRSLERFPTEERVVLVLRRIDGLQVGEIAEQLGVSLSTAKRRLRNAEVRMEKYRDWKGAE